ncbi:MAG: hypothetical protein WHX93_02760 [bacterium]
MKQLRKTRRTWFGVMVFLVGLLLASEAYSAEFPPKKICLVDDRDNLILIANCKLAGPSIKLSSGSYKIYTINALTEGGPMSGSGAFYQDPDYFDFSITGGWGTTGRYFGAFRLARTSKEGSYLFKNLDSGSEWTGGTRLVPCETVP